MEEKQIPTPSELAMLMQQSVFAMKQIADIASNLETLLQDYELEGELLELDTLSKAMYQLSIGNRAMLADPDNYTDGPGYTEDEGTRIYKHAIMDDNSRAYLMESLLSLSPNADDDRHWQLFVGILKHIAKDSAISNTDIANETGYQTSNVSRFFALNYCPSLKIFLNIAKACRVNFFFESKDSKTDLNILMERAMADLGRRPDKLPKN